MRYEYIEEIKALWVMFDKQGDYKYLEEFREELALNLWEQRK